MVTIKPGMIFRYLSSRPGLTYMITEYDNGLLSYRNSKKSQHTYQTFIRPSTFKRVTEFVNAFGPESSWYEYDI